MTQHWLWAHTPLHGVHKHKHWCKGGGGTGQWGHWTRWKLYGTRRECPDNHFTSLGLVSPLAHDRVAPHCTLFVQLNVKCFTVSELWAIFFWVGNVLSYAKKGIQRNPRRNGAPACACLGGNTNVLPPRLTRQKKELSKRIRSELPTSRHNVQPFISPDEPRPLGLGRGLCLCCPVVPRLETDCLSRLFLHTGENQPLMTEAGWVNITFSWKRGGCAFHGN